MFDWIKNFFSSLFGTKETAEIAVKAIAASVFRSRSGLAAKVFASLMSVTAALPLVQGAGIDTFIVLLKTEMAKRNMTSEEELGLGILMGNLATQFPKNSATSKLSISVQVAQYAEWISQTAQIYARGL